MTATHPYPPPRRPAVPAEPVPCFAGIARLHRLGSGLRLLLGAMLAAAAVVFVSGCAGLPPRPVDAGGPPSAVLDLATTRLARAIEPRVAAHGGLSGIWPLADPRDAFASRALLADAAERTLDVQYYIWHGDLTGTLLMRALLDAADRGVRVRLLLDDSGTTGLDEELSAIGSHPNIAVRLFNPFVVRSPKWLGFLTDFSRANRRMHSKSFTADGRATIVGGRNVGDEYFGATDGVLFTDFDVLAIGPAAQEVSAEFERYWTSASAYPVATILPPVDASQRQALRTRARAIEGDDRARAYLQALRDSQSIQALVRGDLDFQWADAQLLSDDPAKGLAHARKDELLIHEFGEVIGDPIRTFDLVSPYFVPTQAGVDKFIAMARRGVRVRVLTNSLEATDVAAVHAGYTKYRRALLEGGVVLYEMRRAAVPPTAPAGPVTSGGEGRRESGRDNGRESSQEGDQVARRDRRGSDRQDDDRQHEPGEAGQGRRGIRGSGAFGSSGSSLHAKTFAVDGARVFVGSFNFDPRSSRLNTELGLVIASPVLARQVETAFDSRVPTLAYQVHLDTEGRLYWTGEVDGRSVRYDTEPGTSAWQRFGISVLSLLPIESLL